VAEQEPAGSFDYEAKRWGAGPLRPKPWFMNGLKLRYLLEDLASVRGRVLDVGCGAGSVAKAVKRERGDLEVFGCDASRLAIAAAGTSPDGVDFRLATAERAAPAGNPAAPRRRRAARHTPSGSARYLHGPRHG